MSDPATARPAICLNMIVRNEAHIVHETLVRAAEEDAVRFASTAAGTFSPMW